MNWKKKALEVLFNTLTEEDVKSWGYENKEEFINDKANTNSFDKTVTAMIEFAKLACEEQKKICAENAEVEINADSDGITGLYKSDKILTFDDLDLYSNIGIFPDKNSILNAPTVNFEEDAE